MVLKSIIYNKFMGLDMGIQENKEAFSFSVPEQGQLKIPQMDGKKDTQEARVFSEQKNINIRLEYAKEIKRERLFNIRLKEEVHLKTLIKSPKNHKVKKLIAISKKRLEKARRDLQRINERERLRFESKDFRLYCERKSGVSKTR